MSKLFVRWLASQLPTLSWRHFGVGALQAYLCEGESTEQRVHIWHPNLVRQGIAGFGDCHDHRFSFVSQVLVGELTNRVWCTSENALGEFDVYRVENARKAYERIGSHDGHTEPFARCDAWPESERVVRAGQYYEFPRGQFHQSKSEHLTVTLITKFDQTSEPARILCPHGAPLVHAFGGPALDLAPIVQEAAGALLHGAKS